MDPSARRPLVATPLAPKHVVVATSGLPSVVADVKGTTLGEEKSGFGKWVSTIVLVIAHLLTLILLIIQATVVSNKNNHNSVTTANVLDQDGDVLAQFSTFASLPILLQVVYTILSLVDGAFYVGSRWVLTAFELAFGLSIVAIQGGLAAVTAFSMNGAAYVLSVIIMMCASFNLCSSIAVIVYLLIHSGDLIQQIKAATS